MTNKLLVTTYYLYKASFQSIKNTMNEPRYPILAMYNKVVFEICMINLWAKDVIDAVPVHVTTCRVIGKSLKWVKLSNSGDLLKLLTSSSSRKAICG